MAVLSFEETHDGRDGSDELDAQRKSKKTRQRKFRAICSSVYDGPDVVAAYLTTLGYLTGVPHPTCPGVSLSKRDIKSNPKSKVVFDVTLTYQTMAVNGNAGGGPGQNQNPLLDIPTVSWSTASASRVYMYDQAGNAIVNSAGQFFESGTEDEDGYWVATVKSNMPALFLTPGFLNYRMAINNDNFTIDNVPVKPLCGFMRSIAISEWQTRNDVSYRTLSLQIAVKSGNQLRATVGGPTAWGTACGPILDDWKKYILDQGLCAIDQNPAHVGVVTASHTGPIIPIIMPDGSTAHRPMCLDGTGGKLDPVTPATAVFIPYHIRFEKPFAPLGLI